MTTLNDIAAPAHPKQQLTDSDRPWIINRKRLEHLLNPSVYNWPIEIVDETGSTNTDLMQRLRAGRELPTPLVRVAYRQTAGRGRRGRAWLAEPGNALLFSLAYPLQRSLEGMAGLSLAIGTAITAGLRALPLHSHTGLALKWPNDILLNGAKLGGVLIETAWSSSEMSAVVIGIGLNVRGVAPLAAELAQHGTTHAQMSTAMASHPVAALEQIWMPAELTTLLAHCLNALDIVLARFSQTGFAPFREQWMAEHAYAGCPVVLFENGTQIASGTAESVDARGQLIIATANGICSYPAGDVSLRLSAADAAPTGQRDT